MDKKIGFIGCGNMGKAILGGHDRQRPGAPWANLGLHPFPDKVAALHDQFGINAAQNRRKRWRKSPTSFLGPLNLAS